MKKKIFIVVSFLILLFGIYNLFWFFAIYKPVTDYEKNFKEFENSGVKIYDDEDGYSYSVKKPDYLALYGNLSITKHDLKESLIVWVGVFGKVKNIGVEFVDDNGKATQIELKNNKAPKYSEYKDIVKEKEETIDLLFIKAKKVWGIELE